MKQEPSNAEHLAEGNRRGEEWDTKGRKTRDRDHAKRDHKEEVRHVEKGH